MKTVRVIAIGWVLHFKQLTRAPFEALMAKLGMSHDCTEDFDRPGVLESDPLRRQVLYRLTRDAWLSQRDVI